MGEFNDIGTCRTTDQSDRYNHRNDASDQDRFGDKK